MTTFQVIFILLCVWQAALALVRFARAPHLVAMLFAGVWVVAAVLIARPVVATELAHRLGIGRGADLVMYGLMITFVWAHYQQYLRYRRIESHVTRLVRDLAIDHAWRPENPPERAGL